MSTIRVLSILSFFLLWATPLIIPAEPSTLALAIQRIGNEVNEETKLSLLRELKQSSSLDKKWHVDIDRLIDNIERWNHSPRLDYFSSEIRKDQKWGFNLPSDSPFYALTYLYRARMLTWCAMEYSNIWSKPDVFSGYMDQVHDCLLKAKKAFPENPIVRMYLGEPIPCPSYPVPGNAPSWAVYQRESLQRISDIIYWWIENRLRDNGEYGGGWGDDCEMWRWWIPALIAFDDPHINKAQAFFSNALLNQPHMKGGYTSRLSDVEHTAEDSSDAMTPMMHLEPDNPQWKDRALRLIDLMEHLWTGINDRGQLQFKSTYFTSERIDTRPERACDSVYHPRAIQPALLYWQRTGDQRIESIITRWMDTWVEATARTERGKPAGIVPSTIHWPLGTIGGVGKNWWQPENYHERLYDWPSAMGMMLHTLLLTYHMTGSESYLQPIRSMAAIRMDYLQNPPADEPQAGTLSWCASQINMTSVLSKYRFLTGNMEFDSLLSRENDPYYTYRINQNDKPLITALKKTAESFRTNFEGYTSEVRYTDRCIRFPRFLQRCGWVDQDVQVPDPMLLYATATGDPGDALYFPLNRVRWQTPAQNIAALVTDAGDDYFQAELFHFGPSQRAMGAELFLLKEGAYQFVIHAENKSLEQGTFQVKGPRSRIAFHLPPRQLCTLIVRREKD